jgi:ATP-dependent protease HslVU (ClpYQ) peptidase subunit
MTTIVAVQGSGWAVVGYDSQVTEEDGRRYTMARGSSKVAKNGEYLLGAAGDVRAINILAYAFAPPKVGDLTGVRLDRFITSRFVPALRACFEAQGYAASKESKEIAEQGSVVLVVVNGTIYVIGEDYSWVRDSGAIYAFGSGGDYALGALYSYGIEKVTSRVDVAQDLIRNSLAVASKLDPGTGAPFHIMTQSPVQLKKPVRKTK